MTSAKLPTTRCARCLASELQIAASGVQLGATLGMPDKARGAVIFAHGSGSSRHSPRNRFVAQALHDHGFATLLMDLLTSEEERVDDATGELRFDMPLLARRLADAAQWWRTQSPAPSVPLGYFGASTGAGAALLAAADDFGISSIVSRGGRPDLAGEALSHVRAPTLLIVGSRDRTVLDLNRQAAAQLRAPVEIAIVENASHLFPEPGALEEVARLAGEWFARYAS